MANSVLETFYILFKTNSEEVKKGSKDIEKAVGGAEKGFSGADKQATDLGKSFNALTSKAVAAFGAIFSVNKIMSGIGATAREATSLAVMGGALGESATELVNWSRAVAVTGGTTEAFLGSINALNTGLTDAFLSGDNSTTAALRKLGVVALDEFDKMKTVLDLLPELADAFERKKLNREAAFSMGRALGLDDATILLIMRGRTEVEKLVAIQRRQNSLSKDQREDLRLLDAAAKSFGFAMTDFFGAIGSDAVIGFQAASAFLDDMNKDLELAKERWQVVRDIAEFISDTVPGFIKKAIAPVGEHGRVLPEGHREARRQKDIAFFESLNTTYLGLLSGGAGPGVGGGATTVNVDNIMIETQATDAKGIAGSIRDELQNQLNNAFDSVDNGVGG